MSDGQYQEEQYVQQPQQVGVSPFSTPMFALGGNLLKITDPSGLIENLELSLRNSFVDKDGNLVKLGEPLMNNEGVAIVLGRAKTAVTQNTVMSHLKELEASALMMSSQDGLIQLLMISKKRFSMDFSARSIVVDNFRMCVFPCLTRGRDADEKHFLGRTHQDITTTSVNQQRPGLLQSIMGAGWGKKQ